jgi:multicomponent Na+:H+ antiporter subunit D
MTLLNNMPPAFLFIFGALLLPFLPRRIRGITFVLVASATLVQVFMMPDGNSEGLSAFGYTLTLCRVDAMSRIFGLIFAFVALAGGVFALRLRETGQQVSTLLYASGALGVAFAGDLFTLFVFWELMAVASTYLIWAQRTDVSYKAGLRYLVYHIFGGGLLFSGILVILNNTGNISVTSLTADMGLGAWLMLAGVGVNAAITPLHAWLSDAYPKATVTGAVFLSAFTTKTAVYVLARVFAGWEILIFLGVIMALYGVIYAILADDMREILSYHIICQVGYMVAAVGIGSPLAVDGAIAHAINNILYKTLMFMAVASVMAQTGKGRLSQLGGLFSRMPAVFFLYMVGALSISGMPLFNGFESKSLIVNAATAAHLDWVVLSLYLASIGTFLSVGLKLPFFCWLQGENKHQTTTVPKSEIIGMLLLAIPCVLFGVVPSLLGNFLPARSSAHAYTIGHVSQSLQMLSLSFVVFWLFRKKLKPHASVLLDVDWIYRRHGDKFRIVFVEWPDRLFDAVESMAQTAAARVSNLGRNPLGFFSREKGAVYSPDFYRPSTQGMMLVLMGLFAAITLIWFLI